MQTDVRTYVFNINNNIMIPTKTVEFSVLDEVRGYLITQSNHVKSKTLTQETKKQNRNELNLLAQMRGCVILLSSYINPFAPTNSIHHFLALKSNYNIIFCLLITIYFLFF